MVAAISGSPEPKEFPDWVHLLALGRTYSYADGEDAAEAVKDDTTAVPVHASNKRSGYLSFTLNPVPEISYLDLHWSYDSGSLPGLPSAYPYLLSVDKNLLLIRFDQYPNDTDLFVYTARASSPPSLRRLPACDRVIDGLVGRNRFMELTANVGILCRSGAEDDFVVADLAMSVKRSVDMELREKNCYDDPAPMMAVLCTFTPKTGEWTVKEMHAPQPQDQNQSFPFLWSCDCVVPFGGRYICWVDYYSGILIRDFSDEDSPCLNYVPFPVGGKQYSDEIRIERYVPESFRRVAAVSQGLLCFIHIGDDYHQEAGGPCQTSELTITVWNLKMTDSHCNWDVLRVVKLSDLWTQPNWTLDLPRRRLEFPEMAEHDPDVLCCVLRQEGCGCGGKVWIVMLDMKNKGAVQSVIPFTAELIKEGGIAHQLDIASADVGAISPLIPSVFSKYLNSTPGIHWDDSTSHPSKRTKVEFA